MYSIEGQRKFGCSPMRCNVGFLSFWSSWSTDDFNILQVQYNKPIYMYCIYMYVFATQAIWHPSRLINWPFIVLSYLQVLNTKSADQVYPVECVSM